MSELEIFEAVNGKPLQVGMAVTVNPTNQYASEWQGQFVVLGINYRKSAGRNYPGYFDVTIGESWEDGGADGWKPEDLRPAH